MEPSLETASSVSNWANIFFIGSLVVGVVSTVLIVWMSNVKEAHWDELRRKSEERIAALSAQGERLRKETAEANDRAAQANARAEEAKLDLEKYKQPRQLDINSFLETLKSAPPAKVEVLYVRECNDCSWTGQFIGAFLNTARWEATWAPINEKAAASGPWRMQPSAVSVRGYPWGVTVVAKHTNPEALALPFGQSVQKLFDALWLSFKPSVQMAEDKELPPDLIRVVVAPKP